VHERVEIKTNVWVVGDTTFCNSGVKSLIEICAREFILDRVPCPWCTKSRLDTIGTTSIFDLLAIAGLSRRVGTDEIG
jgi:hypothetical protein